MPSQRFRYFCHLHQRDDSLLHSGATGRRKNNDRQFVCCRVFHCSSYLFTNHRPHTSHHKMAVHNGNNRVVSFYLTTSCNNSLGDLCLFLCFLDHLIIIRISHRIFRMHRSIKFFKGPLVAGDRNTFLWTHSKMCFAIRAKFIFCHFFFVYNIFTGITLDPHSIRN